MSAEPLLKVKDLSVRYDGPGGRSITAVDQVSFDVEKGSTFGLVGESGCGKSSIATTVTLLQRPSGGKIVFDSLDLGRLAPQALRSVRRRIQIIFQDATASLNPRLTVRRILNEALSIHGLHSGSRRHTRIDKLLDLVGLPSYIGARYPHELSGGQGQRVAICRALAVEPEMIVCDEATSALDVSVQAQIINLLKDLQAELGLTYIFVSHDLSVVRQISDMIGVMYGGRLSEIAPRDSLYSHPIHPYTRALLSAVPLPDPRLERTRERLILKGEPPDPSVPSAGCRFSGRCYQSVESCFTVAPSFSQVEAGHWVRCPVNASPEPPPPMGNPASTPL